jgi:hypothetical protein
VGVIAGFVVGEFIALILSWALLNRDLERPLRHGFDRLWAFALICGAVLGWSLAMNARLWLVDATMLAISGALAAWLWRIERELIFECRVIARRLIEPFLLKFVRG